MHFEERGSDIPTDVSENELHVSGISGNGDFFTDKDVCPSFQEFGRDDELRRRSLWCSLWAQSSVLRVHLMAKLPICVQGEAEKSAKF